MHVLRCEVLWLRNLRCEWLLSKGEHRTGNEQDGKKCFKITCCGNYQWSLIDFTKNNFSLTWNIFASINNVFNLYYFVAWYLRNRINAVRSFAYIGSDAVLLSTIFSLFPYFLPLFLPLSSFPSPYLLLSCLFTNFSLSINCNRMTDFSFSVWLIFVSFRVLPRLCFPLVPYTTLTISLVFAHT